MGRREGGGDDEGCGSGVGKQWGERIWSGEFGGGGGGEMRRWLVGMTVTSAGTVWIIGLGIIRVEWIWIFCVLSLGLDWDEVLYYYRVWKASERMNACEKGLGSRGGGVYGCEEVFTVD